MNTPPPNPARHWRLVRPNAGWPWPLDQGGRALHVLAGLPEAQFRVRFSAVAGALPDPRDPYADPVARDAH